MQRLRTVQEAHEFSRRMRLEKKRLALVPTMGFLHTGHTSLMAAAKSQADAVAVSIFVNPTQFGPHEDFASYPRDLEGDWEKCRLQGVDAVFTPEPADFYPQGFQTYVEVAQLQKDLCGDRRPGHFRGVATIVTKLFALFQPELAFFGEKDYQQLQILTALSRDLNLGVKVVGMPIVREPDGLALSSRNTYLTKDERRRAVALYQGLCSAQRMFQSGVREAARLAEAVREALVKAEAREDYVAVVDAGTLQPLSLLESGRPARILVAAYLGKTRLIDNLSLG